jgi:AraC-like DNA-binding protein
VVIAVYQEYRPDRRLAPLVECGWSRSAPAAGFLRVIPDGSVDLFVSSQGQVMIAGPATAFYDLPTDGVLAGLRLRPGAAAAVLGRPIGEFSDRVVPLDGAWPERVFTATTPGHRIAVLQHMVIERLAHTDPCIDAAVLGAIEMLRRRPHLTVCTLAAAVDLSERQLRRRFESAVGFGPKRLGRILRLQRLLELIHSCDGRIRWSELAIEASYADQAHMINECRALAGVSPVALPGGMSVSSNPAAAEVS